MRRMWVILGFLMVLAGCGAAGPTPTPTAEQPQQIPVVDEARAALSGFLGVDPESVEVVKVEDMEWPTSALGCPAPDTAYLQVITPGYRVTLEAGGTTYQIHTDREGQTIVLCQNNRPVELSGAGSGTPDATPTTGAEPTPSADSGQTIGQQAIDELAAFLSLSPGDVQLIDVKEVEWPSSALGCPAPDRSYAEVVTPGYQITLGSGGTTYAIHTDWEGQTVILCMDGRPVNLTEEEGRSTPDTDATPPDAVATRVPAQPVTPTESPTEEAMSEANHLIDTARKMLSEELGVAPEAVTLRSIEPVEWSSSGLGCEQPGQMYLTVITPGYRIILEHNGHLYEYHTDRATRVIRCDPGPKR